jgi:hypothetical protein
LTETLASVDLNASTRQLALDVPAVEATDIFISLNTTVDAIHKLVQQTNRGAALFIRAPVATGKSTLATYLASHHPDRYIKVATGETEADYRNNIIRSAPGALNPAAPSAMSHALQAMSDKTLIFDEAHLLFPHPNLISALLKIPEPGHAPKYLLFSAAAHGGFDGETATTPPQISRKFMWYPPLPDAATLAASLKDAAVFLSADSVGFFLKLCGGHRGIFMSAMAWVKEQQQQQQQPQQQQELGEWNVVKSVTEVRASLAHGGWDVGFLAALAKSRAIVVNSKYSKLQNIPAVFAQVLVGGAKELGELENQERVLTIAGFLVPEPRHNADAAEFVPYNWASLNVRYGVSNSMMAQYYIDSYTSKMHMQSQLMAGMDAPTSCADLLARALPFMSFVDVVDAPTSVDGVNQSPLSADGLPFEDHYNDAIAAKLGLLNFTVSKPLGGSRGKTDIYVTLETKVTFAIELIMAKGNGPQEHKKHLERFNKSGQTNYSKAVHKCLVTIGQSSDTVHQRVNETAAEHGVDIIGLVVSQAHDSYTMYVKSADDNVVKHPLFFACDRVAKSLDADLNIVSAQELKHIDIPQEEKQQQQQPEEKQNEKEQAALNEAKAELKQAKAELKMAKTELEEAKTELKEAINSGDKEGIERANQGATTAQNGVTAAQDGVTAAQEMVTALTTHVARMLF